MTKAEIVRIGLLYPAGGGEHEYYEFAEALDYRVRPYLVVAGLAGGDNSHAPRLCSVRPTSRRSRWPHVASPPLRPDAVTWACTSGSFILGRAYAQAQASAISATTGPSGQQHLARVRKRGSTCYASIG